MNTLILSCSKNKKIDRGPAWQLYDGPTYRVLRLHLKKRNDLWVLVLSAKYGLIKFDDVIDTYDSKFTPESAAAMAGKFSNLSTLNRKEFKDADKIYCKVSGLYMAALEPIKSAYSSKMEFLNGRPGVQLQKLKNFLNGAYQ